MMKKLFVICVLVVLGFFFLKVDEEVLIPEEAIRFRVVANSDDKEDQAVKELVSREVQKQISDSLESAENVDDARKILREKVPVFRETVENTLNEYDIDTPFRIHYGMNHFPEKIYKGVTYKEGDYESLVVTLGEGLGKNWWCVLFPPICLLEADENASGDVEYKFFLQELLDKYF